jgi:hypothetical protein
VSRDADEAREISRALPGRRSDHEGKKDPSARAGDATAAATAKIAALSQGSVARADRITLSGYLIPSAE